MPPTDDGQNRQSLESATPQPSVYVDSSSLESVPSPVKPEYTRRRPSLFKFNKFAALVTGAAFLIIGLIVGSALIFSSIKNGKDTTVTSQKGKFQVTKLNVSNVSNNLEVQSADKLDVNGQLKVSNTLVLAPTSTPSAPTTGQIYYDKTTNTPYFYNGSAFVPLANSIGGVTGQLGLGGGLSLVNSTIINSGVISIQGQTGAVNFASGPGIAINGSTITNTGLLGISGNPNQLAITSGNGGAQISILGIQPGGVLIGTTGNGISTALPSTPGQCLISNASNLPEFGSCTGTTNVTSINAGSGPLVNALTIQGTNGILVSSTGNTISVDGSAITLPANYVSQIGPVTGLTVSNNSGQGSTPSLSVTYGSAANTSVQGNVTITCPTAGTNLTGGGGSITLGTGGACNGLSVASAPIFSGAVQTLAIKNSNGDQFDLAGSPTGTSRTLCYVDNTSNSNCPTGGNVSRTGTVSANRLSKFDANNGNVTDSSLLDQTTGLQVTATSYYLDLYSAASNSTFTIKNTDGTKVANLDVEGAISTSTGFLQGSDLYTLPTNGGNGGVLCYVYSGSSNCPTGGNVSFGTTHNPNYIAALDGSGNLVSSDLAVVAGGLQVASNAYMLDLYSASNSTLTIANTNGGNLANLQVSGSITAGGTGFKGDALTSNAPANPSPTSDLVVTSTNNNIIFSIKGGTATFTFPTTGGTGQTICTSGISCATGGGQALLLEPQSSGVGISQDVSQNYTSIWVNKSAGTGNVIQLQKTGVDAFLINNSGAAAFPNALGLTLGTVGSKAGILKLANATNSQLVNLQVSAPSGVGDVTLNVPSVAGGTSYDICLSSGNCAGAGGGITGSGTSGVLAYFTGGGTIGSSVLSQSGGNLSASGDLTLQGGDLVLGTANSVTGSISFKHSGSAFTGLLQQASLTSDQTYSLPDASGDICLSSGNCVGGSGGGAPNNATYLTVGNNATLSNERAIAAGTNLTATDGGANSSYTLSVVNNPTFSGMVTANGGLTVGSLSGVVKATGGVLSAGTVALGTETTGNYVGSIGTVTGLTLGGTSGAGAVPTLAVNYGSAVNTAVQGNVTLQVAAGTGLTGGSTITLGSGGTATLNVAYGSLAGTAVQGNVTLNCPTAGSNLTGGGGTITLGTGGNCNALAVASSPSFSGNVIVQGSTGVTIGQAGSVQGNLVLATTGAGSLTLQSDPLASNYTVKFPTITAGDTICLFTAANCAGVGGGVTATGSSNTNFIPRFTGNTVVTAGSIFDNGSTVVVGGSTLGGGLFNVGTTNQFQVSSAGAVTAVGVNYGAGLLQGSGGITATGAISLNNTGSGVTQIGGASAGNITLQSAGTISLNSGATAVSVPGSGGLRVGTAGSIQGKLVLSTAGAGSITLLAPSIGSDYTVSIPGTIAANDTICLQNTANCSGGSLQTAYTASTGSTTPEIRLDNVRNGVDIQDADTTLGANTNLFAVRASATSSTLGTSMFNVTGSGTSVHKTTTNNGAAFQVQNATSDPVINVDTYNNMFTAGAAYYSSGTISQSGSTVTGSGTSWVSGMAAGIIIYDDGTVASINTVNSPTSLSVSVSKTVTAGSSYTIRYGGLNVFKSTGGAYLQTTLNNTAAFLIQNSNALNLLAADTSNMKITVNGNGVINGGLQVGGLTVPSAPTVTNVGTAGSTTYTYVVTARNANGGETTASPNGTTATGNATLNGSNFNRLTFTAIAGAKDYKIYRTVGGATQGLIGTTSTVSSSNIVTFDDTGLAGSGTVPVNNTSGDTALTGNLSVTSSNYTGNALSVTGNNLTSGNLAVLSQTSNYSGTLPYSSTGNVLNLSRSISGSYSGTTNVALDATYPSSGPQSFTTSSTSWTHTVGSYTNRAVLVTISGQMGALACTVTYGGVAMTQVESSYNATLFAGTQTFLLVNPTVGDSTVQVSNCNVWSTFYPLNAISYSLYNVNQGTAYATVASTQNNPASITSSSTSSGDMMIGYYGSYGYTPNNPGAGQTVLMSCLTSFSQFCSSYKTATGASTTISYGTTNIGDMGAVVIKKAATAAFGIEGALSTLSSNCTASGCIDSSNILNLNQQYASASGAVVKIQNAGTGLDIQLGSGRIQTATGTATNGVAIQSGNGTTSSGAVSLQSGTGNTTGGLTLATGASAAGNSGAISLTTGVATSGLSGSINIATGNGQSGSGNLSIATGNATLGNTNSGSITIDTGTASGSGTAGAISIGTGSYAHNTNIGNQTGNTSITVQSGTAGISANSTATSSNALTVTGNNLTSGNALSVLTTSLQSSGNLVNINHSGAQTNPLIVSGNALNTSRSLTSNTSSNVGFDALYPSSGYQSFNTASTSWTHTVGSYGNRAVLVIITGAVNSNACTATYGGVAMTQVSSSLNAGAKYGSQTFLLVNPPVGDSTVQISSCDLYFPSLYPLYGHSVSLYNVNQGTAYATVASTQNNPASITSASTTAGDMMVGIYSSYGYSPLNPGSGQNVLLPCSNSWAMMCTSYKTAVGASTTMSYTTTNIGDMGAVVIKKAASSTLTISGALANLSSNCTIGTSTCTDTSNVLNVNQQYGVATGASAYVQNAGSGAALQLISTNDTGTGLSVTNMNGTSILSTDTGNLVNNPSIELDANAATPTNWTISGAGNTFVQSNVRAKFGNSSGLLTSTGTGGTITANLTSTLLANTTYTASFWVYNASGTAPSITFGIGGTNCASNPSLTSNSTWTQYNCTITTGGSPTNTLTFGFAGASMAWNLDGVRVNLGSSVNTGNIQLSGYVNNAVTFRNATNSVSAFQIQNASGSTYFNADSTNSRISVGSTGTATGQLYIGGIVTNGAVGAAAVSGTTGLAVNGRYGFIVPANGTNGYIRSYDLSNPASPVGLNSVATISATANKRIKVQGKYAYVAGGGRLEVFDISNPYTPTSVGSITYTSAGTFTALAVQGRYAYVSPSGTQAIYIFDISNPANITLMNASGAVTSYSQSGVGAFDLYVQGNYLYAANNTNTTNAFQVVSVANPSSPAVTASISTTNGSGSSVWALGRYAYFGTTNALYAIDVSNPASITLPSPAVTGYPITALSTQGRYLYAGDSTNTRVLSYDISTPGTPTLLNATGMTGISAPYAIQAVGRYLFIGNNSATNTFQSVDLGGAYIQQLETGGVETDQLSVRGNANFTGDTAVQGSLSVGASANIQGDMAVGGTSKFTGNLLANNYATATATYSTTVAATTNTTSVTVNSATGFAAGDTIFIDNAGQDYFTRITNISTNTFTVSPAVSVDANSGATPAVTKYVTQSLGLATNSALATPAPGDRFFQGYFLGGVVTGTGSTTLSDGSLASTGAMNYTATTHTFNSTATTQNALVLAANTLTTGAGLSVSSSSANLTTGNIASISQTGTFGNSNPTATNTTLNVSRSLTDNVSSSVTLDNTSVTSSLTINSSNPNRAVFALVTVYNGTVSGTPTFGGVSMNFASSMTNTHSGSFTTATTYIYYLTGNVNTGTFSFSTSGGTSTYRLFSMYNVNQTSPMGSIQQNQAGTAAFSGIPITVPSATGEIVLAGASVYLTTGAGSSCSAGVILPTGTYSCIGLGGTYSSAGFALVAGASSVGLSVAGSGDSGSAAGIIGFSVKRSGLVVSGSVANFSSNCTNGTIGCVDSSYVLNLNQQFSTASGAVFNIQNAGTGADIQIGSNNTGKIQTAGGGSTSQGMVLQSGNTTSGTSGGVTLQSGTSAGNTGAVSVVSGNSSGTGTTGGVTISTGATSGISGNLSLTTGSAGTSGNINIATGGAYNSGTITLQTYAASFGTGGNIFIKTNGDASGTSGGIQLTTGSGGGSGSITIDTGSASFTPGSIAIGNGAFAHTTTVGNQTGASALNLYSGTGNVNIIAASTGTVKVSLGTTASTNAVCSTLANATSPTAGVGYSLVDCNAAPAADYAERYPVAAGATYGDIVAVGSQMVNTYDTTNGTIDWSKVKGQVTQLVKTNSPYQNNTIGIVSDNYGDFTSAGANIKDEDNPMPVALAGRVPVKVSASSEPIQPGDYLTTSTESGKAMKATGSGYVIGKALAAWTPGSGDTVMVYVEPGYHQGETIADMIQNGSDANLNNLTVSGTLTVTGVATFKGNIIVGGHIITQGDTPTATINSAAGAGAICTVSGNDTAGQITITTGAGGWAAGEQCAINFANSYSSAPRPVITPANGTDTSTVKPFVDVPGSAPYTSWNLNFIAPDSGQHTYKFNYFNVQ